MPMFSTGVARDGDTTFVTLAGELDIATVPELRAIADAELDRPDCRRLVLDLAELGFIDSTGIGCWVQIRTHALAAGKRVVVRDVPLGVRRVLEISGLLPLFIDDSDSSST